MLNVPLGPFTSTMDSSQSCCVAAVLRLCTSSRLLFLCYAFPFSLLTSSLYNTHVYIQDMTPRISCDPSILWPIGPGHLLDWTCTLQYPSHAHDPAPCGSLTLSSTFYAFLSHLPPALISFWFHSILFYSLQLFVILLNSIVTHDVLVSEVYKPLYDC